MTILIEAPDPGDEGRVVLLWKKVRDLVDLFLHLELLPVFEIIPKDGKTSWFVDGEPALSISKDECDCPDWGEYSPDYLALLIPFCRLRGFSKSTIIAEGAGMAGSVLRAKERKIVEMDSFGVQSDGDMADPWSDKEIQKELDRVFLQFDRGLDNLRNWTARK